jgi:tetratricopeptide (TPR) repeat protein
VAEALTRGQSRRRRKLDARERELKRLRLSVCDDVGFRLYLATYDQPKGRDELIERVVREAEADKVRVTRLDLAEAGPEANLVGLLRAHLQKTDLPPGWREAVMVTGIEQRVDYSAGNEGFAFLHQANLLRDALPEAAPVPVVLWLSRMASAALPAEAPDLWHWRAANFDFTGDEAPRLELLRELTTLQPENGGGLAGEHRRARTRTLEELLEELNREGLPKSKRQAAERANLLIELGIELLALGRMDEVLPRLEQALEAFRQIGDRRGEGRVLGHLGIVFAHLGELRRAIEHYEDARMIMSEVGARRAEGSALAMLGSAYAALGEPRRAIEHYKQALEIAREIGDRRGECDALGNLGNAYLSLRKVRRAIDQYEGVVSIAREISDRRLEGRTLGNLGLAYATLGEMQRAIEHHERAHTIAREIGDRRGESEALGDLGFAYIALGEPRRAIEHFEQARALMRETGDRLSEGIVLGGLGDSYAVLGEPRPAIEYFERALVIAREIGDRQKEGDALYDSALALDQLGERREAIRRMEEALRIYRQIESPSREHAQAKLAEWQSESGDGG